MLSLTKWSASFLHPCLSTPPRHSPSHSHIFRLQPQRPRASPLPTQVSCWAQQRCGTLEEHVHLHTASPPLKMTWWGSDGDAQSQPHTNSTCSHSHTKSSPPRQAQEDRGTCSPAWPLAPSVPSGFSTLQEEQQWGPGVARC